MRNHDYVSNGFLALTTASLRVAVLRSAGFRVRLELAGSARGAGLLQA